MAAATTSSDLFDVGSGYPIREGLGTSYAQVQYTPETTELDDDGDRIRLIPIPGGTELAVIFLDSADLDTGAALDADIVLNDANGDTVLVNAGAGFQSATKDFYLLDDVQVAEDDDDAYIGLLVNTAAATAISAEIKLGVLYHR